MGDLFVHVRMKECCRLTLKAVDKQRKKAKFTGGMLAKGSWLKAYGDKTIEVAKQAIFVHEAVTGGELEKLSRAICKAICEKHAALHQGKGETGEAELWKDLGEACHGKATTRKVVAQVRVTAALPGRITQPQAAELGNKGLDALQGALKSGLPGAIKGVGKSIVKDFLVDKAAEFIGAHGHPDAAAALKGVNTLMNPILPGDEAIKATKDVIKYEEQIRDQMEADVQSPDGIFWTTVNNVGGAVAAPFEFIQDQFKIPIAK